MTITRRHKGEELDALPSCYERARTAMQWANECRNSYFNGRRIAAEGLRPAPGDKTVRRGDAFSREYGWKTDLTARDLVSLEQMYRGWAMMYYAQVTAECAMLTAHVRIPNAAEDK